MYLLDGSGASDGWKTGRELGLTYTGMVDRGDYRITPCFLNPVLLKLHIYTIYLFNYILLFIYIHIFVYKLIYIHKSIYEKWLISFYF